MKVIHSSIFRAVCAIIVGVLLIQYREQTVTWITIAIGVLFFLSGVISLASYWAAKRGGTAGMVTIEDILEEIVGEIQDEFDEERPEVEEESDKTYSIDGKMLLEDVNDLFGLELSSNSCDTIGGWVYSQLDYPPQLGQSVKLPKAEFLVEELDNIRITRLKVKLLQEPGSIHQGMLEEQLNK